MENVIIAETRGGNPKYIIEDLPLEIVARKDGQNSHTVHMQSKELSYNQITGRQIKNDRHMIYITSVKTEAYPIFCESLINHVRSLASKDMGVSDIVQEIYDQYHNETQTKKEVGNLGERFKKLNKEYKIKLNELNEISKEMDYICKLMEML